MLAMTTNDKLTRFFAGEPDDQGRTYDEILSWDDDQLEMVHDYIQWVFPLPEPSSAMPWAPVLTPETIETIRNSQVMQERLLAGYRRMLTFYGFVEQDQCIVCGPHFQAAAQDWLRAGNHNHLRLTRMLRSLRILGREQEAAALWQALRGLREREKADGRRSITDETFAFWRRAATEPTHSPQDLVGL